ncbi:MAG: NADH-quinone oxidoreductase subunit C [Gammaproteobacteria bacterium]|nr:NADH-quinone oxidoreductase subunit C [Gammaproteobacteria bacterium]
MSESSAALAAVVRGSLAEGLAEVLDRDDQVTVQTSAENVAAVALSLRDNEATRCEMLIDLCGVDYSAYGAADWKTSDMATRTGFSRGVERGEHGASKHCGPRFAVVYQLLSITHNHRIRLRVPAPGEPPMVPSMVDIWASANWFEREAFDLFGILFSGHPDLRRILTDYGFVGHPFRKDFPLSGHVETRYDPSKGRVVYEPVSIEPRTLVPRVIRNDARYHQEAVPIAEEAADGEVDDA